ncbi:MAG: carbamoyltransferase HypF, partial [Armatimonadota bacterium]
VIPVRRARGYVPRSVAVDYEGPAVLAVGGQQKNTFCLLRNREAILSQHIGDLDTAEVLEYFGRAVRHFEELFETKPEIVAHDLHPGYLSTQWAKSLEGVRLVGVQHHHAHVVSVMAEFGLEGPVIGVAYDGTGYGADGTVWGGEILVADRREFRRAAHLRPVRLPGGEGAIRRPARTALSHLIDAFGPEQGVAKARGLMPYLTDGEARVVARQVERGINSPMCSSMGRLFDAVAAMLGATAEATYEGQPAMELESMAHGAGDTLPSASLGTGLPYEYGIVDGVIDTRGVVRGVVDDLERGVDRGETAERFHERVARFTVDACKRLHEDGAPSDVALCGGVMQNARLAGRLLVLLEEAGLKAHVHREVPPNDGGMSLGQAVVAAARRI